MAKYCTVIIENLSLSKKIMQDLDIKTKHIFYTLFSKMQGILGGLNFIRKTTYGIHG